MTSAGRWLIGVILLAVGCVAAVGVVLALSLMTKSPAVAATAEVPGVTDISYADQRGMRDAIVTAVTVDAGDGTTQKCYVLYSPNASSISLSCPGSLR